MPEDRLGIRIIENNRDMLRQTGNDWKMIGNDWKLFGRNCLEMFGNSVILWWQDHVLGHLSYLPPHALYKIRILLNLQWNFQLWA